MKLPGDIHKQALSLVQRNLGITILVAITGVISTVVLWKVFWPTYKDPANRTYTSRLGYPAMLRLRGVPFPVSTGYVEEKKLSRRFLGEGLIESEPVRVPIIPSGRVARVYVKEGDYVKKGQLLAELDTRLLDIKIQQAKTDVEVANAQLERAKTGSPYLMAKERPEIDQAQVDLTKRQVEISRQLVQIYGTLRKNNTTSIENYLTQQLNEAKAIAALRQAQEDLKMSQAGRPMTLKAADLALQEARLKLEYHMQEFKDYKVYSSDDGIVSTAIIHEGEYNLNATTPAFILAVGRWFGGNFDQTTIGRFAEGSQVDIRLEAFPGRVFRGRVLKVKPVVAYSQGGPESTRPIRPLGTGSPEWPATFNTRIELDGDLHDVVPGLTGFAQVNVERTGPAVPSGSLTSVSAGKGVAYVVQGDTFQPREVLVGQESDGWIEIRSGLEPGMQVITDGYQVLKPGDRIAGSPAQPSPNQENASLAQR